MRTYTALFEESEGWITAWVEELPGAIAQERTLEEARESLKEAIGLILESRHAHAREGHAHILSVEQISV
jgi:predicted RNase H-like HicB family nuclease